MRSHPENRGEYVAGLSEQILQSDRALARAKRECLIGSARNTGVGIGEVDAGIRQTDVVNDTFQLLLRYFLADRGVNTADLPRNLFDTGPAL
jgi:hypothetical protein